MNPSLSDEAAVSRSKRYWEVVELKQVEVVGAVIYEAEKGFLCALRGKGASQGGLWEFPGGKIEPGEKPEDALVREIEEELGCRIRVNELVVDTFHNYPQVRVHLATYFAAIFAGTPYAKEHQELRWVRREQLPDLHWAPADLPTVQKLMQLDL